MAKATLVFTDKPNGNVSMTMEFEPAVSVEFDSRQSAAQGMAVMAMKAAKSVAERYVDGDTDDDL